MIENQMTVNVHWEKRQCPDCGGRGKRKVLIKDEEVEIECDCDNGEIEVQR